MKANGVNHNARLNVLLVEDRSHAPEHWTAQLPRLLGPQGVAAYIVRDRQEVIDLTRTVDIHTVILDLSSPFNGGVGWPSRSGALGHPGGYASGSWLQQLGRILPNRPPVIVVRGPAYSPRQVQLLLREALRLGVFSVVNAPVDLEHLLMVLRRMIDQQYRGHWPGRLIRKSTG